MLLVIRPFLLLQPPFLRLPLLRTEKPLRLHSPHSRFTAAALPRATVTPNQRRHTRQSPLLLQLRTLGILLIGSFVL